MFDPLGAIQLTTVLMIQVGRGRVTCNASTYETVQIAGSSEEQAEVEIFVPLMCLPPAQLEAALANRYEPIEQYVVGVLTRNSDLNLRRNDFIKTRFLPGFHVGGKGVIGTSAFVDVGPALRADAAQRDINDKLVLRLTGKAVNGYVSPLVSERLRQQTTIWLPTSKRESNDVEAALRLCVDLRCQSLALRKNGVGLRCRSDPEEVEQMRRLLDLPCEATDAALSWELHGLPLRSDASGVHSVLTSYGWRTDPPSYEGGRWIVTSAGHPPAKIKEGFRLVSGQAVTIREIQRVTRRPAVDNASRIAAADDDSKSVRTITSESATDIVGAMSVEERDEMLRAMLAEEAGRRIANRWLSVGDHQNPVPPKRGAGYNADGSARSGGASGSGGADHQAQPGRALPKFRSTPLRGGGYSHQSVGVKMEDAQAGAKNKRTAEQLDGGADMPAVPEDDDEEVGDWDDDRDPDL